MAAGIERIHQRFEAPVGHGTEKQKVVFLIKIGLCKMGMFRHLLMGNPVHPAVVFCTEYLFQS